MSGELKPVEIEYVYMTIPAEYVCVYHRILAMLADYGEEMLEDCKAACKDRNSTVIDCFNMFNAAVAARKLGKDSLANTLITYIKSKINQIYKGDDNSTSFVFPVDENGQLKAFVSCGERPHFEISPDDGQLFEHKFGNGFPEHFYLGVEDGVEDNYQDDKILIILTPSWEIIDDEVHPCAEIVIKDNGKDVLVTNDMVYQYYFDNVPVRDFKDVVVTTPGVHYFGVIVNYDSKTYITNKAHIYETS